MAVILLSNILDGIAVTNINYDTFVAGKVNKIWFKNNTKLIFKI